MRLHAIQPYYLFFVFTLLFSGYACAEVKATTDQAVYFQGDPITLSVETNSKSNTQPNINPLLQDFNILGSNINRSINIINGVSSIQRTLNISLQAKRLGKLTIPTITWGKESTKPFEITVKKLPESLIAETSKHIFIETSVDIPNKTAYVQQQIPYTVKLFYDSSMQSGQMILPEIPNSNFRELGERKKYQVVRAGKKYVVVEKHFVISPEKSGTLTIPPTKIEGRMSYNSNSAEYKKRRDEFDRFNDLLGRTNNPAGFTSPFDPFFTRQSFGPTRPFSVSSEALDITVLPIPKHFSGTAWLPAENLTLHDSWSQTPPTFSVGEPVLRRLVLIVKGLAGSQIPDITIPKPEGAKRYPEQAEITTPNDGKTIYGKHEINIAYIPDQVGNITIPAINIDWWDVIHKKQRTFTLPAWDLKVAPALHDEPSNISNQTNSPSDTQPEPLNTAESSDNQQGEKSESNTIGWQKIFAIGLTAAALAWLMSLLTKWFRQSPYYLKQRRKQQRSKVLKATQTKLLDACTRNDKHTAAQQLLAFAQQQFSSASIPNLASLATQLHDGADVVTALQQSVYAPTNTRWQGAALERLIKKGLQLETETTLKTDKTPLAPLYPD